MKNIILSLVIFVSGISYAYASIPEFEYYSGGQKNITNAQLKKIAIEKGIIPVNVEEDFIKKEIAQGNSISCWIALEIAEKVELIDNLKGLFAKDGVTISFSPEYYVREINDVIYNSILNGDIDESNKRGVGIMFKTIAIMDGDFDDGTDRIELLKKHVGEELFERYKEMYPDKYHNLISKQKEFSP